MSSFKPCDEWLWKERKWVKTQCGTMRLEPFKIGTHVRITVRKVWIAFSESYPYADLFWLIYRKLQTIPIRA